MANKTDLILINHPNIISAVIMERPIYLCDLDILMLTNNSFSMC